MRLQDLSRTFGVAVRDREQNLAASAASAGDRDGDGLDVMLAQEIGELGVVRGAHLLEDCEVGHGLSVGALDQPGGSARRIGLVNRAGESGRWIGR